MSAPTHAAPVSNKSTPARSGIFPQRTTAMNAPTNLPPIVHQALQSPGVPLDENTRDFMEPRFGHHFGRARILPAGVASNQHFLNVSTPGDRHEQMANQLAARALRNDLREESPVETTPQNFDFSEVKIHTDAASAKSARAMNALAYTIENHIFFGERQFNPASAGGRKLLAHELAHVVHRAGALPSQGLPVLRQMDDENKEARRQKALSPLDGLETVLPFLMDDDAPALIKWSLIQEAKFENPETSDEKQMFIAQGLIRAFEELKTFESRAKRGADGALIYTDSLYLLTNKETPWTENRAQNLKDIPPFTEENISEWQEAAKPPRATAQPGRRKNIGKTAKSKPVIEPPRKSGIAQNLTFHKQAGMTLSTEAGQRLIMDYVVAQIIGSRKTAQEREAAVTQLGKNKSFDQRWAPPDKVSLDDWKKSFDAMPDGTELTLTITDSFLLELQEVFRKGPRDFDLNVEGFRQGVVAARGGVDLGILVFGVGATVLTGGLAAEAVGGGLIGEGVAGGGLIAGEGTAAAGAVAAEGTAGGGLFAGGAVNVARNLATYAYLNAPTIYGSGMLYGGAALTGKALAQHLQQIRRQGYHPDDIGGFAEDLMPLTGGMADDASMRTPNSGRAAPTGGGGETNDATELGGGVNPVASDLGETGEVAPQVNQLTANGNGAAKDPVDPLGKTQPVWPLIKNDPAPPTPSAPQSDIGTADTQEIPAVNPTVDVDDTIQPPNPPSGGGGGDSSGGRLPRQTLIGNPPPMPARPPAAPISGTPNRPGGSAGNNAPPSATDVEVIQSNVRDPASIKPQDPVAHQQNWVDLGGSETDTAPLNYHDPDGNIRVSTKNPLLAPATRDGLPPVSGGTSNSAPKSIAPTPGSTPTPANQDVGTRDTGPAPVAGPVNPLAKTAPPAPSPANQDIGTADTGNLPAPTAADPPAKTPPVPAPAPPTKNPAAPNVSPGSQTGEADAQSKLPQAQRPRGQVDPPQAISQDAVEKIQKQPRLVSPNIGRGNNVGYTKNDDKHNLAWRMLGGYGDKAPLRFIHDGQVYLHPSLKPTNPADPKSEP
jgi:hypothetical protein